MPRTGRRSAPCVDPPPRPASASLASLEVMDLGIRGKVALVTGASKGLGFGVAQALAQEGAAVAISSRSQERIDAAAARLGAKGFVHDAANADAAPDLVRRVQDELGPRRAGLQSRAACRS